MKQKKIGDILYVYSTTAYEITEDTDATVIKIQQECIPAYAALNASLVSKFQPINYKLFCVRHPEWADYMNDFTVIIYNIVGEGTVTATPNGGDEGEEITLSASPATGWEFTAWLVQPVHSAQIITVTDNKFLMPADDVKVQARFDKIDFDITVDDQIQNGSLSAPATANLGDTVTITATPASGYKLDTLTVMCGSLEITVVNSQFTMPAGDVTITGTFALDEYDITITPASNGTITSDKQTATYGETVTLTATPATGYALDTLTVLDASSNPITVTNNQFTMPAGDVTVTGTFVQDVVPYEQQYFTIESLEDNNTIGWKFSKEQGARTIQVSTDLTEWTSKTSSEAGIILHYLNAGDKLYIKGNMRPVINVQYYSYFVGAYSFKVYGNIMSLIHGDEFANQTTIRQYDFKSLFKDCTTLTDASNLILPATTLATACYASMFNGCTSLTAAPTLAATTLTQGCYSYMFQGCTSLTTAPELPATTLVQGCYQEMFNGCTSLNSITMLATDISASNCLSQWVSNVAASGTFTKDATMTTLTEGQSGIPAGWTVQDYTPSV